MPIQIQSCAIVVMLVVLYFYQTQKRVSLSTGRAYWRMFVATFVSLGMNIFSCQTILNPDKFTPFLREVVSKVSLASLLCVMWFVVQYIYADICPNKAKRMQLCVGFGVAALAEVITMIFLPIDFFYDDDLSIIYSFGSSIVVSFIFCGVTILFVFVLIFMSRKKMTKDRKGGILLGLGLVLAGGTFQYFTKTFMMLDFSLAMCMAVLYIRLENPSYNLDAQTGLFNQNAFNLYTAQLYKNKTDFSIIELIYDHDNNSIMRENGFMPEIVNYVLDLTRVLAFRGVGNEIIILTKNSKHSEQLLEKMKARFEQGWGDFKEIVIHPYWIYVPNPYIAVDTSDLMRVMCYVRMNSVEYKEKRFAVVDETVAAKLLEDKEVSDLIIRALNNDRVEVFYQPIYSTKEHKFTAAEALVRIRDDNGDIVPPGKFISIAESNGLIMKLGEAVFCKVCSFIGENDLRKIGIHYIEVNLSVVQCGYERLAKEYIKIMKQYDVSPDMINLEITESASSDAKATLLENMRELMDFGVNFSLDDFGTGQSNLNYIMEMPVEIVKFDRGMTNAYFDNSKAKYIMDAAMNMIHGMNLDIVSEGVETKEQLQAMEDLNISYIQGYYFSKPLPMREFLEFVTRENGCG